MTLIVMGINNFLFVIIAFARNVIVVGTIAKYVNLRVIALILNLEKIVLMEFVQNVQKIVTVQHQRVKYVTKLLANVLNVLMLVIVMSTKTV